jgi:pyridoxal biosynthesis lyase PdxS
MSLKVTQDTSQYTDNKEHDSLFVAKRVTEVGNDSQTLMDYVARTDTQPVYVGSAARGVASSADGWLVKKITYDGSDRPTVIQNAVGAWDSRASLSYS